MNIYLQTLYYWIPRLLFASAIILLGYAVAKVLKKVIHMLLTKLLYRNKTGQELEIDKMLTKLGLKVNVAQFTSVVLYYLTLIITFYWVATYLNLNSLVNVLNKFFSYFPNIIASVVILGLAVGIGGFANKFLTGLLNQHKIKNAEVVGKVAEGVVVVFGSLTALTQLGFDTELINANITLIIAGLVLTFVLAVGIGAKETVSNLIASYYIKKSFSEGDVIQIGKVRGTIKEINNLAVIISDKGVVTVIPSNIFLQGNKYN